MYFNPLDVNEDSGISSFVPPTSLSSNSYCRPYMQAFITFYPLTIFMKGEIFNLEMKFQSRTSSPYHPAQNIELNKFICSFFSCFLFVYFKSKGDSLKSKIFIFSCFSPLFLT